MPRVVIRKPHYLDGQFHDATPEFPRALDVDDETVRRWAVEKNSDMELVDDGAQVKGEKLGKHFADQRPQHVQSAAQMQSEPKSKRAADKQPI